MILLESSECACQWALRSYGFLCLFHLYNLNLGFCILRTGFLSICERFRCWTSAFPSVGTGRFKVPCFLDVIFCLYCQFPGSHLVWQSADLKYNFGNRRRFPLQWLLALCYTWCEVCECSLASDCGSKRRYRLLWLVCSALLRCGGR